ncbi:PAS domain S-box protein [Natronoglomus mannanivorans]|uniref:histidine kinase n=1 Tax=Natronoglomus mannanivorans TaxID=2979990 RepID=A0AAP2Z2M2_9EURY|nr:PAS domain S-box protein [Halobacteria archaeon AArc-xg1-1]
MVPSGEANAELRTRIRQQAAIADLSQRALETDALEALLHDTAVTVSETLDTEYCAVFERTADDDDLVLRDGVGWREGLVGTATVPDRDSHAGYTLNADGPVVVDDLHGEDRFTGVEFLASHDVSYGIGVVVGTVEQPWGVLGAYATEKADREFTDADATFLRSAANVLANAIETVKTNQDREVADGERNRRDETDRTERERELARFKRAVEASGHAIHMSNLDEEITYVNSAFCETTGYTAEEAIGKPPSILESGEHDDDYYRELRETVRSGEVWEADIVDQRKNGELYHAEQTIAPVTDENGEIDRFVAVQNEITERKERERDLEESEARFRMLAENLEEMVWISDTDTREVLYVNAAYERIWGRDRESLYDDPRSFLEAVHPDDRQRVERAYAAVPDEEFDEEYRIVRPDGEVRWLHVRAVPADSDDRKLRRAVGIAEDVTERTERERALEESERRYRTLVENFPNGAVGLFDEDLCYTAVGGELLNATGVAPADRVGHHVSEIYPDELVSKFEPHFHAALEGETTSFEVEYHDRHLYAHTLPVRNADDEVFAGMLVVQDVTERREYQRQLEESNQRLEQFAYAASHDLQEPLRMVSSYLQLIDRRYADALDEDGEEFLAFAVDGAERMREMIDGLLEYSRVETRGDEFEPVDLDAVLEDVRDTLRMKIDEDDAEITAESLPRVEGDAGQLRQVFQNLLANAIDYSGEEPPRVHVAAERTGTEWTISVTDEGVGIDPVDQERIFEVFQRVHSDDSGTGIGLALCERIVERHDGEIWVDSEPGEGTTFSVTLPAVGADDS